MTPLESVATWQEQGSLSKVAADALGRWLLEPQFALLVPELHDLIAAVAVDELEDAFRTRIEFGTGGIRGKMGPGPNRINIRTIGEAAQGLSEYVTEAGGEGAAGRGIAIAFDTRRNSERFARETAAIAAGNGVTAHLFEAPRATPELSFAVRELGCVAGVVISASHNPPSDNGFKAYWSDGGQVVPPHDKAIIAKVQAVTDIRRADYDRARVGGLIRPVDAAIDRLYVERTSMTLTGSRQVRVVFTPLHGVGASSVVPALAHLGFSDVQVVSAQNDADGRFPTVPGGVANPEDPAALTLAIDAARAREADLVLASDPDADRLGCALPLPKKGWDAPPGDLALNGNQIGVLCVHYLLERLKQTGALPARGVFCKTIVTTDLSALVAGAYGVRVVDDLLVGFKYIADVIQNLDAGERFVFGTEESHGYLATDAVRDKDAASAASILCQCAAHLKAQGRSVRAYLDDIYRRFGYFCEVQKSIARTGAAGSREIQQIMSGLRQKPPARIGPCDVVEVIDRQAGLARNVRTGVSRPIPGARGNVLAFTLTRQGHTRVTARPSGTEPKIKYYVSAASVDLPDCRLGDLQETKAAVDRRAREILEGTVHAAESFLG